MVNVEDHSCRKALFAVKDNSFVFIDSKTNSVYLSLKAGELFLKTNSAFLQERLSIGNAIFFTLGPSYHLEWVGKLKFYFLPPPPPPPPPEKNSRENKYPSAFQRKQFRFYPDALAVTTAVAFNCQTIP